jgi:hypothetical protein
MAVQGLLAVVAPRVSISMNSRFMLPGFENPGDLEPRDWYVRSTRVFGIGMAVAGAVGLLTEADDGVALAGDADDDADESEADADEPVTIENERDEDDDSDEN